MTAKHIGRHVMFSPDKNDSFISGEITRVQDGAYTIISEGKDYTAYETNICPVEGKFAVEQPVLARFRGEPHYRLGTITVANPNGTYSVFEEEKKTTDIH